MTGVTIPASVTDIGDGAFAACKGLTAFEVAERAFDCHLSQRRSYRVYGADYPNYDCHVYGLYRSLVGPDEAKNDLTEHLDVPAEMKTEN